MNNLVHIRPTKPLNGISKLSFQFNSETIENLQKLVKSYTENDWNEWICRQQTYESHSYTKSIRCKWVDISFKKYQIQDTQIFSKYSELDKLLHNFFDFLESHYDGKICRIIITRQNPNITIPCHKDTGFTLTYAHRIHVPILTKSSVIFYCGNEATNMQPGFVYEINNQQDHSVKNNSDDYKIHIIIDIIEHKHINLDPFPSNNLFIHIPKTAGTSITEAIKFKYGNSWVRNPFFKNHDPYFELQETNVISKDTFVFSVVRNPFTRTYSYYRHFKKINNVKISFKEFLFVVRNKYFVLEKTPFIYYNQSFYLHNNSCVLGTNKIYKFEELYELEFDLSVQLNMINMGSYLLEEYNYDYGNDEQNLVRHLYAEDFSNFKYDLDFK